MRSKYQNKFQKWQVIGQWTVLDPAVIMDDKGRAHVLCRCDCGEKSQVSAHHLANRKSTQCKKCSRTGDSNPNWRGAGIVSKKYANKLSQSVSNDRGSLWSLSPQDINEILQKQNYKCLITGESLTGGGISGSITLTANNSPIVNASIVTRDGSTTYNVNNSILTSPTVGAFLVQNNMSIQEFANFASSASLTMASNAAILGTSPNTGQATGTSYDSSNDK